MRSYQLEFLLFLLVSSFVGNSASAGGEVQVTITVPSTKISVEEPLDFTVSVQGDRQASQPVFPASPDYELSFAGTSSQVQIINGEMSSSTEFSYSLQAKHPGPLLLGPCTVEASGKTYGSNQVSIEVLQARETPPEERLYFVLAAVDTFTPYLNQQVTYTFKLYHRVSVADAQFKQPEFSGFAREELGKQRQYQEVVDGQQWEVTALSFALFPTSLGKITIDAAGLGITVLVPGKGGQRRGLFSDFFDDSRRKRVSLQTKPIELEVIGLPQPTPPAEKTLLVGHYSMVANISPAEGKVGDSLTATVVIEGEGNIWDAQVETPKTADFKIYADKPTVKTEVKNGKIAGVKQFKFALVPLTAGTKPLPKFQLHFFDPVSKTYQLQQSNFAEMLIAENEDHPTSSNSGSEAMQKRSVNVVANDLMPIKTDLSVLNGENLGGRESAIVLFVMLLGPGIFMAFYLYRKRQDLMQANWGANRRKKAYGQFKRELASLLEPSAGSKDFYQQAAALIRRYLGDRFAIPGQGLTTFDIARHLGDKGLSSEVLTTLTKLLQRCEEAQYGGGLVMLAPLTQQELTQKITEVIALIEKQGSSR